jgi:adenylate cyclase
VSEIFISYSRKDSEQALSLAERLRGEGMSVWIDQQGIEAAKTWSEEIVNAIEGSKAFLLLLSSHSVESGNVAKELSLAYESERTLIPVMIEDVPLTAKFKYPLAGVQRVAYTQFDAITSALVSCGVKGLKAIPKKADGRKSLLVMPFEDLSPTQDNLWFADGLAGELIDKLSHIKSLRLIDRKTSRDLRTSKLSMYDIASTLDVQYVVEGSVRKFGEQIKISASLLDVSEGDHLWQQSHKGTMNDVFELQEQVAESVVDALTLHLDKGEREQLKARLTANPEAYEFYLKSREQYSKYTRQSIARAAEFSEEATRLDPSFARAYGNLAIAHIEQYRVHDRSPSHLIAAEEAVAKIREIEGETAEWCRAASVLARVTGRYDEAIALARRAVESRDFGSAYEILAFALKSAGDMEGSIAAMQKHVEHNPDVDGYNRLLVHVSELGYKAELKQLSEKARPIFEKYLKLNPDDFYHASTYASILFWLGDSSAALAETLRLLKTGIDGQPRYNLSCLLCDLGELDLALKELRETVERGYSDLETLHTDTDLDPIRSHPEFSEIVQLMEQRIAKHSEELPA